MINCPDCNHPIKIHTSYGKCWSPEYDFKTKSLCKCQRIFVSKKGERT